VEREALGGCLRPQKSAHPVCKALSSECQIELELVGGTQRPNHPDRQLA